MLWKCYIHRVGQWRWLCGECVAGWQGPSDIANEIRKFYSFRSMWAGRHQYTPLQRSHDVVDGKWASVVALMRSSVGVMCACPWFHQLQGEICAVLGHGPWPAAPQGLFDSPHRHQVKKYTESGEELSRYRTWFHSATIKNGWFARSWIA